MLLGLTGYAGVGKDEVAKILVREHNFKRYAFADRMREALYTLNPRVADEKLNMFWQLRALVDLKGWDYAKREVSDVRKLLQRFGTEVGREMFGEGFWVDMLHNQMMPEVMHGQNAVITDVRFANESIYVYTWGGYNVRVSRPGVGPANGHSSEALDFEAHYELRNERDLAHLRSEVNELVRRLPR